MPKNCLPRFAKYSLGLMILCAFLLPRPAAANPVYSFTVLIGPSGPIDPPYGIYSLENGVILLQFAPTYTLDSLDCCLFLTPSASQTFTYYINGVPITDQIYSDLVTSTGGWFTAEANGYPILAGSLNPGGSAISYWAGCHIASNGATEECDYPLDYAFTGTFDFANPLCGYPPSCVVTGTGSYSITVVPILDSTDNLLAWKETVSIDGLLPTPEPSSLLLLGTGLLGLLAIVTLGGRMRLRRLFPGFFITVLVAFCLLVSPRPVAASPTLVPVIVTGGADACSFLGNDPYPQYACVAGGIIGGFTFDTLTNAVVGPWSVDWAGYIISGDGSLISGNGNVVVSGPDLANDQIEFFGPVYGLVFDNLNLVKFGCPVGNGGDFCTFHGSLIPVPTPEPPSLLLLCTGLLGLGPLIRRRAK